MTSYVHSALHQFPFGKAFRTYSDGILSLYQVDQLPTSSLLPSAAAGFLAPGEALRSARRFGRCVVVRRVRTAAGRHQRSLGGVRSLAALDAYSSKVPGWVVVVGACLFVVPALLRR